MPAPTASKPLPNISNEAGSGTVVGGVGDGLPCGVGVGSLCSSQLSQSCMNATGTTARNKNGHFGKPPPAIRMSPQSQIVPSTSPSSMSSTPIVVPAATVIPEMIDSVLPPTGIGACVF